MNNIILDFAWKEQIVYNGYLIRSYAEDGEVLWYVINNDENEYLDYFNECIEYIDVITTDD